MFWASLGHILCFGCIFGHIMDTFGDFASKMCLSPHRAPVPQETPCEGMSFAFRVMRTIFCWDRGMNRCHFRRHTDELSRARSLCLLHHRDMMSVIHVANNEECSSSATCSYLNSLTEIDDRSKEYLPLCLLWKIYSTTKHFDIPPVIQLL